MSSIDQKAKLLCNFGGEFTRQLGKLSYVGGKTRLVLISRFVNFDSLRLKMSQLCSAMSDCAEIKYQLPNETLESRLVSVECDDDVVAMMSEFDASERINVFIFDTSIGSSQRERAGPNVNTVFNGPTSGHRENATSFDSQDLGLAAGDNDLISFPRVGDDIPQASVDSHTSPAISELVNGRENHTFTVGQEFPDAQGFRDVLIAAAISSKFELTFIRSDRTRVTATCAADGCHWRIHASKLPEVETFQIKTLNGKHSCIRPERSSHRQANMKWILSCIMDRVRENINYKAKDIMRDIEQEHGVIIPYLKAHRAKERALELIYGMPIKDIVLNQSEVQGSERAMHNLLGQQRKKPLKGSPVHCNMCKKVGHNRRTCIKSSEKETEAGLEEKKFRCMLCKQSGHNRRTCQCKVDSSSFTRVVNMIFKDLNLSLTIFSAKKTKSSCLAGGTSLDQLVILAVFKQGYEYLCYTLSKYWIILQFQASLARGHVPAPNIPIYVHLLDSSLLEYPEEEAHNFYKDGVVSESIFEGFAAKPATDGTVQKAHCIMVFKAKRSISFN